MGTPEKLLNPTGSDRRAIDSSLAPRPASLRGLTIGLLGNTKPNAEVLLSEIAGELKDRYDVGEFRSYTKDYFGTPVKPDLLAQVVADCDMVITAVGDCGSCSAATVADGILLERAGVPAVSICTDSFVPAARAMATVYGFPAYEFVTMPHPLASLDQQQIDARARELLPEVVRILGVES